MSKKYSWDRSAHHGFALNEYIRNFHTLKRKGGITGHGKKFLRNYRGTMASVRSFNMGLKYSPIDYDIVISGTPSWYENRIGWRNV